MSKILVVDDEDLVRDLLVDALRGRYELTPAKDAEEALGILEKSPFELALLDIQLPGRSGIELLQEMKEKYLDTAVVMVSGVGEIETALTALKLGAYDYITKPFSLKIVESRVEQALDKRRLVIENRNYQTNLERLVKERTEKLLHALEKIEATYDATIRALGAALDLRDSETEDHSMRVSKYVLKLARAVGVQDPKRLKDLEWGAFLHDIGKIGIPDSILLKPGKLSEGEMKVIRTHPDLGHRLLHGIPFLQGAAELVLSHHEWYDGNGYPRALKGEKIPLSARLFAVADTIDAITSDRPYRKALPLEEAGKELRRLAGVQYDPQVVQAFFSVPEKEWGLDGSSRSP